MEKRLSVGNEIVDGVIWKQLLRFFFPIVLGTFFQQLYNTVDAVVVGQFVGKEALAAVGGTTGTLTNLLVGFFTGLASGATVVISQFFGAGRHEEVRKAVHTAVALSIAVGVAFMVLGLTCAPAALRAMGTPADIMGNAVTYIRVYFLGILFPLAYNMGAGILRAVGDSKRPLYFLIVCCLVNLVLDVLFVAVWHMGVFGAALATFISQAVSAILVVVTLLRTEDCYRLFPREIRFTPPLLRDIVRIGLPAGLQSVMYSASNILIQSSVNALGTDTIAAWTAFGKIDGVYWMVMSAFGVSATTFVGQNFGARAYQRIRECVKVCFVMAMGTTILMSTILFFSGPFVYRLFTNDSNVIVEGMKILRIFVPLYFTYVSVEVLAGAVRGTGDALRPMLMTCVGVCVLRAIWIFVVVPLYPGMETIVVSYPITWTVTSVLFIVYYLRGNWLKRQIAKAGYPPEEFPAK